MDVTGLQSKGTTLKTFQKIQAPTNHSVCHLKLLELTSNIQGFLVKYLLKAILPMPRIYRTSFLFTRTGRILQGTLPPASPREGSCCQSSLSCWYKVMGKGQHMQTGRPAISLMSTVTFTALCNKLRSGPKRNECFISATHILLQLHKKQSIWGQDTY